MKNIFVSVFLFIIFLIPKVTAQSSNVIVDLGFDKITASEFKFRFETTPFIQTSKNIDSLKFEFLLSLIAEKLLAQNGTLNGLGNSDYVKTSLNILEKYLVRDKLYKEEVISKVNLPDSLFYNAIQKSRKTYTVNFLHSQTKEQIDSLYQLLVQGADFDSLLSTRPETAEQIEEIKVGYGQMENSLEDVIFSLLPNEYSVPVLTEKGWLILSVSQITYNYDEEKNADLARSVLENRETVKVQDEFYRRYLKGKNVNAERKFFNYLLSQVLEIIEKKVPNDKGLIEVDFYDIEKIKKNFTGNELSSTFIKLEKNPVSLEYFLDDMAFNSFRLEAKDKNYIASMLSGYVKNFIQSELIAQIGYERNYQTSPEIVSTLKMWEDNYIFSLVRNSFIDSVSITESEISNELEKADKFLRPDEVKIIEILVSNLDDVTQILNELDNGAAFNELAVKFNERGETQNTNGEYDWFPINENGEIGRIASTLEVGEVFGPINLIEGYSLIKLIDRRKNDDSLSIDRDTKIELAREKLFYEKLREKLSNVTANLAIETELNINRNLLDKVRVSEIPSMVYRYYGFGGATSAAPYLAPFFEWYKKYLKANDPL